MISADRSTLVIAVVLAVAACGGDNRPTAIPAASELTTPTPSIAIGDPLSGTPRTSATAGAAAASPSNALPAVDDTLLAILPAEVDGVPLQSVPDVAQALAEDPKLATSVEAIAVGIVAAPQGIGDFATASVVRLRSGTFSDDFFSTWRRDYDEAACAPAGGVASHEQRRIGDRVVDVASCTEAATTYHVHYAADVLVSVTAVGDRGFGDLVMAGLRE